MDEAGSPSRMTFSARTFGGIRAAARSRSASARAPLGLAGGDVQRNAVLARVVPVLVQARPEAQLEFPRAGGRRVHPLHIGPALHGADEQVKVVRGPGRTESHGATPRQGPRPGG